MVEIRYSGTTSVYKTKSFRCQNSDTRPYCPSPHEGTHVKECGESWREVDPGHARRDADQERGAPRPRVVVDCRHAQVSLQLGRGSNFRKFKFKIQKERDSGESWREVDPCHARRDADQERGAPGPRVVVDCRPQGPRSQLGATLSNCAQKRYQTRYRCKKGALTAILDLRHLQVVARKKTK
jgi:hypothetical protein